jgi:beta-alanine--pyruvate transaminase
LPPPQGYLQRLREICDKHGILLIFDEVITGFGRLGYAFAAERYGVVPDMITFAKGITSGTVPMGGVLVRKHIHEAFMKGPEHLAELAHGYTYSAHPLACAAALATLDLYRDENLFEHAREMEPVLAKAVHSLRGEPNVVDIRNLGLAAAVDLAPVPGAPAKRGYDGIVTAFEQFGVLLRSAGDTLVVTPPLIISESEIRELIEALRLTIRSIA